MKPEDDYNEGYRDGRRARMDAPNKLDRRELVGAIFGGVVFAVVAYVFTVLILSFEPRQRAEPCVTVPYDVGARPTCVLLLNQTEGN